MGSGPSHEYRTFMSVPGRRGNTAFGLLSVTRCLPGDLTEGDVRCCGCWPIVADALAYGS